MRSMKQAQKILQQEMRKIKIYLKDKKEECEIMENKPYVSWKQVRNNLNIRPEQETEIQLEKGIIEATIKARDKIEIIQIKK